VPIGETGKVLLIARWGDAKHCFGSTFFGSIEWGLARGIFASLSARSRSIGAAMRSFLALLVLR
jgi:hypothetical protein